MSKEIKYLNGYEIVDEKSRNDISEIKNKKTEAIIDVYELPTENINECAFYRLMSAKWVSEGQYAPDDMDWTCHCVESLPTIGDVCTDETMSFVLAYYSVSDNEAYGYVDSSLAENLGISANWYTVETLLQIAGYTWGGFVENIDDTKDSGDVFLLLSQDYYIYQDGWCKLAMGYEKEPEFDIRWDGVIGDRFALDLTALGFSGVYYVKISDEVLTQEQIIGATYTQKGGYECTIIETDIDTETYAGAMNVNGGIIICYSSDDTNAALGLPTGYLTDGLYFVYDTNMDDEPNYTNSFVAPSKVVKIDEKFLPDMSVNIDSLGLHSVATTGNYNDLYNKPTIYTDVIRYNTTQSLSSTCQAKARTNIDVYSKDEVDSKINEIDIGLTFGGNERITLPTNQIWNSIVYDNSKFIATGNNDAFGSYDIVYSTDGINWNVISDTEVFRIYVYRDGKYIGCSRNSNNIIEPIYSEDGITWTKIKITEFTEVGAVVFGNGKFIKVNQNSYSAAYSEDGITWTNFTIPFRNACITYGNGKFVMAEYASGTAAYSEDGITWTEVILPKTQQWKSIVYGNGKFILSGSQYSRSNIILYSEDAITWNKGMMPSSRYWNEMCYESGKFIAFDCGHYTSEVFGTAAYSEDGITWTEVTLPSIGSEWSVCYGNDKFVAVAHYVTGGSTDYNNIVIYSYDGVVWKDYIENDIIFSNVDVTPRIASMIQPYLTIPQFLTSPNGTRYQITVDDNGNLITTAVTETTE